MVTKSKTGASGTKSKKRAPNAYNLFMKKTMEKLSKEDAKMGRKPDPTGNMRKIGVMWSQEKAKPGASKRRT